MVESIRKAGKKLLRVRDTGGTGKTSDGDSGSDSRIGRGVPPGFPPYIGAQQQSVSMLAEDTVRTEWERREQEQMGEGHYGKVNVKERHEDDKVAPEGELQNDIAQHPMLNRQTYDGVPVNDSNVPPQNTEARREYDNAKRLQHQKQLQLKNELTNQYQPSSAPTPRPGG